MAQPSWPRTISYPESRYRYASPRLRQVPKASFGQRDARGWRLPPLLGERLEGQEHLSALALGREQDPVGNPVPVRTNLVDRSADVTSEPMSAPIPRLARPVLEPHQRGDLGHGAAGPHAGAAAGVQGVHAEVRRGAAAAGAGADGRAGGPGSGARASSTCWHRDSCGSKRRRRCSSAGCCRTSSCTACRSRAAPSSACSSPRRTATRGAPVEARVRASRPRRAPRPRLRAAQVPTVAGAPSP